jgi:hypothetical protein
MATEAEQQVTRKMGQSPPNSRLKAPQEEPHHGHHQPGMIVERRDGLEALTYLARADKRLFRHDADALDFAHHLHVDAVLRTRRVVVTQLPW